MSENHEETPKDQIEVWKQADKVRMTILAMIYHELRTPLTAIKGYSDLMVEGHLGDFTDQQNKAIKNLKHSIDYIMETYYDFFNMYRSLVGIDLNLQIESIDLEELIQSAVTYPFTINVSMNLPKIRADRTQLEQAIRQLANVVRPEDNTQDELRVGLNFDSETDRMVMILETRLFSHIGDYPDWRLFHSNYIVEQHGGHLRLEETEEKVKIVVELPVFASGSGI